MDFFVAELSAAESRMMTTYSSSSADVSQQNYPSVLVSYAFDDPSPAAFDGALAVFTLAALYLHALHREDRYQNHCQVAGIAVAAVISGTRYFLLFDEPLAHSIQICVPTSIMVASVFSAIIHRMGSLASSRAHEHEWEQGKETIADGQEKGQQQGS